MADDPFSDDDSAATWVETGPPQVGDTVELRVRGKVTELVKGTGGKVSARVVLDREGPFALLYLPVEQLAVVERADPAEGR